jgi:hypothetical protein
MASSSTTRRLRWALGLVGVALVVLVAYTGYQALQARSALKLVADDFTVLADQLTAGDATGARATLEDAQEHATDARDNTDGPGWWLTGKMPGVGPNIEAVRTVAGVSHGLAHDVLPDVVVASETLKPENLRPDNGRVDLAPIEEVAPVVVRADEALQRQVATVEDVDTSSLSTSIAEPVDLMADKLGEAARLSDRASRAVRLLPPMLGADGRRDYLLLFQNNAEVRATGGIPGSFAVVSAEDGRVRLGSQGDAATIGRFDSPPIPLTADERTLYGENLGRFPQNVTFTPDFTRSAELARAMWNDVNGLQVDGVISADPVALSYLLAGTGPVDAPGGRRLTADNAVDLLLSDVYAEITEPAQQNVFFNAVAGSVFDAVASGRGEPKVVLDGLVRGASERRLMVWSSVPEEQELLAPTKLGGALPTEPAAAPEVGVYLNDGSGNKMSYYLRHRVDVTQTRCEGDRQYLDTTVDLRSTAPDDVASLPDYVAASGFGSPRGTIRTTFYVYAPVGGFVEEVLVDGEPVDVGRLEHDGREVVSTTLDLAPGEQRELSVRLAGGEGQLAEPVLRTTPGAFDTGVGEIDWEPCS